MSKLNWMTKVCGVFLLWAGAAIALPAQTLTTLDNFDLTNGESPAGVLVQGTDGKLYGTTVYGGTDDSAGTVFNVTTSGTLATLASFSDADAGAADPFAGLVQAANGSFYGTSTEGGTNNAGTIFKITPSGVVTTLYSFDGTDGQFPYAALVQATDGNFYGTTELGGAGNNCNLGCGTVFEISPSGALTTLHSFDGRDGQNPNGLVQATDGNFYGTTELGGASNNCDLGCGTVFKITPSGTLTTLHSFAGYPTDGAKLFAGLVQGTNGDLYGTAYEGGANNEGTVFKITPSGVLTTLASFDGTDGAYPFAGLVQATDGSFYGTTNGDGINGYGTAFKITPSGTFATLYNFCSQGNCVDGAYPYAPLVQDTNGMFYGTTECGGVDDDGTIFSLSLGLGPFVETLPNAGPVGGTVKILGTDLTGATGVTFDGTAAVFTVVSHSLITATVPAGATTGKVEVTVPSGTLSSNVRFTVRP